MYMVGYTDTQLPTLYDVCYIPSHRICYQWRAPRLSGQGFHLLVCLCVMPLSGRIECTFF